MSDFWYDPFMPEIGRSKDVTAVEWLNDHRLILTFEGGERRTVDIASLAAFDGVFEPLNDPAFFRRVTVNPDVGTIVWSNGADLCPDVLYERGRLSSEPD